MAVASEMEDEDSFIQKKEKKNKPSLYIIFWTIAPFFHCFHAWYEFPYLLDFLSLHCKLANFKVIYVLLSYTWLKYS